MHTDTDLRIKAAAAEGLTVLERIERAKARAAQRDLAEGRAVLTPLLPDDDDHTDQPCIIITADQLQALVYQSVSNVLRRNTSLTVTTAQQYATRAAAESVDIARADGWL